MVETPKDIFVSKVMNWNNLTYSTYICFSYFIFDDQSNPQSRTTLTFWLPAVTKLYYW